MPAATSRKRLGTAAIATIVLALLIAVLNSKKSSKGAQA